MKRKHFSAALSLALAAALTLSACGEAVPPEPSPETVYEPRYVAQAELLSDQAYPAASYGGALYYVAWSEDDVRLMEYAPGSEPRQIAELASGCRDICAAENGVWLLYAQDESYSAELYAYSGELLASVELDEYRAGRCNPAPWPRRIFSSSMPSVLPAWVSGAAACRRSRCPRAKELSLELLGGAVGDISGCVARFNAQSAEYYVEAKDLTAAFPVIDDRLRDLYALIDAEFSREDFVALWVGVPAGHSRTIPPSRRPSRRGRSSLSSCPRKYSSKTP